MTYPPQQPGPQQPGQPYQPPQPGQPYPQQPYPQQPGAYPQQPGGYPPAATQPKSGMGTGKVLLIVLGALVGLCCIGGIVSVAVNSGRSTSSTNGTSTNAGAAAGAAQHARIGQAARDGKFEFVVQKIDCGKTEVGDDTFGEKAQGQFCLVSISVKNISNQPQTFDGGNQKAAGSTGAKYDDSTAAEMYANQSNQTFLNNINPGNQVAGVLVYDIPKDATIKSLELHDSAFSGGVTVDVG